ncbi:MAG: aminoglycoside phosphotransferase family protein [Chloroflexota bacterium]|nr:aminoglycoside phosphotransferase family protein [Chloroflexota bacterium]
MTALPPPAEGVRLPWSELPAGIRLALDTWLPAPIISATNQPGGFSPGVAARVQIADGYRVFVKAVGPELNPDAPEIYRREARIVAALPVTAPVPRLLWIHDEGDDGWIMLVFEDVEGWNPAQPWRASELDRVLEALGSLSASLTPSPIEAVSARGIFTTGIVGWRWLQEEPPEGLDGWSARHLDALAALEATAGDAVRGETLLHFDFRADNVLLTPSRVFVVDWPWACIGAAWVDLVTFAPSVAMQGGPRPEELLTRLPAARNADPGRITAALAAIAGYFTRAALLPAPPGLPTLRAFQGAQGFEARRWLARRTGWT